MDPTVAVDPRLSAPRSARSAEYIVQQSRGYDEGSAGCAKGVVPIDGENEAHAQSILRSTRYTQGPHATEQLGAEIRNLGIDGPAFIVAGRSAIRLPSEMWKKTFAAAGMRCEVFPFGGECTAAEIRRVARPR
jgi:hypothetical protein